MSFIGRRATASLRHVLTLLAGTGLAQLIALAAAPMLSRLFVPEDFGVVALYLSVVSLLALLATGRYELAIVLPESDDDARHLLALALLIAASVGVASLGLVAAFGEWLAQRAGYAALAGWLYLLPISVLFTAVISTLTCWANRQRRYAQLAANRIAQSVVTSASGIALGVAGLAGAGLMLGNAVGQGLTAALLVVQSAGASRSWQRLERVRLSSLARRYINFPRLNLPHALLDAVQATALLALMGAAFGGQVLGWYAFALRIARTPLAALGGSVGQVFQQRAAQVFNEGGDLAGLTRRAMLRLAAFTLPFGVLMAFAPMLFAWAFGPDWREAGVYARILAPWMVLNFLTSPLSQLPLVVGQQGTALAFGVAYQISMLAPYALAYAMRWEIRTALSLQSAASSVVLLVYGVWLHRLAASRRMA